jgi:uncharacterized SAM-binding protein YcdF (DUF218 family)
MADLLRQSSIPDERIILDEVSTDTLSSVKNCTRILSTLPNVGRVIVCSDIYHIPRCRWLFYMYGVATVPGPVKSGLSETRLSKWIYFCLREIPALPWDTLIVLKSRVFG